MIELADLQTGRYNGLGLVIGQPTGLGEAEQAGEVIIANAADDIDPQYCQEVSDSD